MATFTVVCVYNSEVVLAKYLQRGLARQSADYELRLVDNTTGRFTSASSALNHGAVGARTDYVLFAHQDVELLTPTFFQEASAYLSSLPNLGVAGVVGAAERAGARELRGKCLQGDTPSEGFTPGYDTPLPVQTVDEQLMIVPTAWFAQAPFDGVACPSWDLYGVEYALRSARRGRDVCVLPLAVRHASWGSLRWSYFESLSRVQRKYPEVSVLHTTCGSWPASRAPWELWALHQGRAARGHLQRYLTRRTALTKLR